MTNGAGPGSLCGNVLETKDQKGLVRRVEAGRYLNLEVSRAGSICQNTG